MSRRKRFKVKQKQKTKRKRRIGALRKKNLNLDDYYSDGVYIGPRGEK